MEQTQTLAPPGTQAVDRAAALLVEIVEAERPRTFGALMAAAGLPKSTASRLLGALERPGLVQRDRDGAFRPGPVLVRYARRGGGTADLVSAAQPFLEELGVRTGETINLGVPVPGAAEPIAQVDSRYLLGAVNWVGMSVPLHCSALGKVFLAHGVCELPAGRLERRTERTVTSRATLASELDTVLERDWALSDEELETGLVAVAAPVRARDGAVIAALSVSGPSVRLTPDRVDAAGALAAEWARALSAALGHRVMKEGAA